MKVYGYLRSVGVNPKDHAVSSEIKRIQEKFARIQQVKKRVGICFYFNACIDTKAPDTQRVDQSAARRLVLGAAGISGGSTEPVPPEAGGLKRASNENDIRKKKKKNRKV